MIERYRKIQQQRAAGEISDSGFTLIELLIVIVVLGILAAIVIFSLTGVTGTSAVAACQTDAKTVETAVAAFESANPGTALAAQSSGSDSGLVSTYLHVWPSNSTLYTITTTALTTSGSGGVVMVTPNGGTAVAFDSESGTGLTSGGCGAA